RSASLIYTLSLHDALPICGVLTDWAGWAWIFFTNVPVCLVVMMLCPTLLPESPRNRQRLDLPGAVTATGALTLMLLALFRIAEADRKSTRLNSSHVSISYA